MLAGIFEFNKKQTYAAATPVRKFLFVNPRRIPSLGLLLEEGFGVLSRVHQSSLPVLLTRITRRRVTAEGL